MTTTTSQTDRTSELEKEVKSLTRLIREAAAREKVLSTQCRMLSKDHSIMQKELKDIVLQLQKNSAAVMKVSSQVQSKK